MYHSPDLSVLAYANNFTQWHYTTTDKITTVMEANYFNKAHDMLRVSDLIILNADTDGKPVTKFLVVTANDGGNVEVTQI
jgi:hypothetical protein